MTGRRRHTTVCCPDIQPREGMQSCLSPPPFGATTTTANFGNGSNTNSNVPVTVSGLGGAVGIGGGNVHSLEFEIGWHGVLLGPASHVYHSNSANCASFGHNSGSGASWRSKP